MPRALHSDRLILRPWREADLDPLFAINGGYHTLQFTLIGLVLALWPAPG